MRYDEEIQKTLEIIEQKLDTPLTTSMLAGSAFLSRHYFQRLFRSVVGVPVMEYVKKRRLELAAKELARGQSSVLEVALICGYSSHEGFSRAFKREYGVSPSKYQAINKKENADMAKQANIALEAFDSDYFESINKTAALLQAAYKESGLGYLAVLAEELQWLYKETLSANSVFAKMENSGIEGISRHLETVKLLEEAGFRLNTIAFAENIYFARTAPQQNTKAEKAHKAVQELASSAAVSSGQIIESLNEVCRKVYSEIKSEAAALCGECLRSLQKAAKELNGLIAELSVAMDKAAENRRYFYNLLGELENIATELDCSLPAFETADEAVLYAENAANILAGLGLRMNILAFDAKLAAKQAAEAPFAAFGEKAVHTAGVLHSMAEQCEEKAEQAAALLKAIPAEDTSPVLPLPAPQLPNTAFRLNLLLYYLRAEHLGTEHSTPDNVHTLMAEAEDETQAVIGSIYSSRQASPEETAAQLCGIAEKLEKAAGLLEENAADTRVLLVLANELAALAVAVRH